MSKIVLSTPPFTMEELYGGLARSGNTMPSMGLCTMAAVLRKDGCEVKIVEPTALNMDLGAAVQKIVSFDAQYVGITSPTILIHQAARLASELKKINNRIITILGGAHITAVPRETMADFPEFDIGCIGEGEETVSELISVLENKGNLKSVQGIVVRENGKILVTQPRPFIQDLDKLLFPAWDLLEKFPDAYKPPTHTYRKLPVATLITSRGCPYQCVFCDTSVFGRKYRFHSAKYVYEMAEMLYKSYGIKEIIFYDDSITTQKERLIQLCGMLKNSKMKIQWSCFSRVNNIDKEILKVMRGAGCWQIGYGVESGSQEVLDILKKKITLDQVRNVIRWTKESGISPKGFFMIGNFLETKETIAKTINFAKEIALDYFQITNFTPFPGSEVYNIVGDYGLFEKNWKKMNMLKICFVPRGLTSNDLLENQRKAYLEFYLRPRIIFEQIQETFANPLLSLKRIYRGVHSLVKIFFDRQQQLQRK